MHAYIKDLILHIVSNCRVPSMLTFSTHLYRMLTSKWGFPTLDIPGQGAMA